MRAFQFTMQKRSARRIVKKRLLGSFCFLTSLAMGTVANATLIGDSIDARWQFNTFDETTSFLVVPGSEGAWRPRVFIDIEASSIAVDYQEDLIGQTAGTIWTFSSLDWVGTPGIITGFSVSTNWTGWQDSFVSFGTDLVRIDFLNDVSFNWGRDFWRIDLVTSHNVGVHGSSTLAVFSVGLLSLAFARRKRTQR